LGRWVRGRGRKKYCSSSIKGEGRRENRKARFSIERSRKRAACVFKNNTRVVKTEGTLEDEYDIEEEGGDIDKCLGKARKKGQV